MEQTTDYSKSDDDIEKLSGKRNHIARRNMEEQHQRIGGDKFIRKEQWTGLGGRWNCLC